LYGSHQAAGSRANIRPQYANCRGPLLGCRSKAESKIKTSDGYCAFSRPRCLLLCSAREGLGWSLAQSYPNRATVTMCDAPSAGAWSSGEIRFAPLSSSPAPIADVEIRVVSSKPWAAPHSLAVSAVNRRAADGLRAASTETAFVSNPTEPLWRRAHCPSDPETATYSRLPPTLAFRRLCW